MQSQFGGGQRRSQWSLPNLDLNTGYPCGRGQSLRDLLAEVASGSLQDTQSPGVYLREDLACGAQVP